MKIGHDAVVIGDVDGDIGNGAVVIRPDKNGNIILNTTTAIGHNAYAGKGSIAIGAGASAGKGASLAHSMNKLADVIGETGDEKITEQFNNLVQELSKTSGKPDKSKAKSIIESLKNASALNGALSLIGTISELIDLLT